MDPVYLKPNFPTTCIADRTTLIFKACGFQYESALRENQGLEWCIVKPGWPAWSHHCWGGGLVWRWAVRQSVPLIVGYPIYHCQQQTSPSNQNSCYISMRLMCFVCAADKRVCVMCFCWDWGKGGVMWIIYCCDLFCVLRQRNEAWPLTPHSYLCKQGFLHWCERWTLDQSVHTLGLVSLSPSPLGNTQTTNFTLMFLTDMYYCVHRHVWQWV